MYGLSVWWQREWDCRFDSCEKAFVQPGEGKKGSENNFRQEIYHSGQEEACPDSLRAVNCFCHWISSIASKCCPADILKETGQRPFSQSFFSIFPILKQANLKKHLFDSEYPNWPVVRKSECKVFPRAHLVSCTCKACPLCAS